MKRIFHLPVLAGAIVMAAVLASLAPTASSRVYAQVTVYYPYGQGPYGGYGQGYVAPYGANRTMFPSQGGMLGTRAYGYSGYGNVPYGYGYRFDYGNGPYVRTYGGTNYYQPSNGPVYVPFGYQANAGYNTALGAASRENSLRQVVVSSPGTERSHNPSVGTSRQGVASTSGLPAVPQDDKDKNRGNRRRQTQAISPSAMRAIGVAIGQGFTGWDTFLPKWYAANPGVWVATGVVNSAWDETSWSSINSFFATNWPENYYDYGNGLTLNNDAVCLYGQPYTSAAAYAQAARDLAFGGLELPDEKQPWLPLGIFTLTNNGEASAKVVLQLAVNKGGLVRGNYYRAVDKKILLVQGSIYGDTQRIAWIIGGNKDIVFDTGLYNLTHRETPVLVHSGPEETEQLLMVRMKRP